MLSPIDEDPPMYTVAVKDHCMIAHSLTGAVFGPAQRLHGATFHVTAEFRSRRLNPEGIVIDIGLARAALQEVLATLNYQNLDDLGELEGANTTTEFLAAHIHGALARRIGEEFEGTLRVVLEESHIAWAAYEAPVS